MNLDTSQIFDLIEFLVIISRAFLPGPEIWKVSSGVIGGQHGGPRFLLLQPAVWAVLSSRFPGAEHPTGSATLPIPRSRGTPVPRTLSHGSLWTACHEERNQLNAQKPIRTPGFDQKTVPLLPSGLLGGNFEFGKWRLENFRLWLSRISASGKTIPLPGWIFLYLLSYIMLSSYRVHFWINFKDDSWHIMLSCYSN